MEAREIISRNSPGEPTAYSERDEEDLREVVSHLEEGSSGENQTVGSFIERIDEEIRDEVGAGSHFEAPIRSLNNPETDSFETEDGTRLQIVGEEFGQLNNVLPQYADIGNIQYWIAAEPTIFREEDVNPGGEHIAGGDEHSVEAYAVKVDGEFRSPEEIDEIMEDMNIRQANNLFGGMEVPGLMLEYSGVDEAVQNEDITEEDFRDQYQKARSTGLVSENGNLTLKGMLRAVDMEAQDLESLEALGEDSDSIGFRTLDHENFPYLASDDEIGRDASVEVSPEPASLDSQSTTGRVTRGEPEGELAEQLEYLEDTLGFSAADVTPNQDESYTMSFADYRRKLLGEDVSARQDLGEMDDRRAAEIAETVARLGGGIERVSTEEGPELKSGWVIDRWSSELGYTQEELRTELDGNTEINLDEDGRLRLEYHGDRDEMKSLIESFSDSVTAHRLDDRPVDSFEASTGMNEVYLELLPHRDELEDRVDFKDSAGSVHVGRIRRYGELSSDAQQTIEDLEENGAIETEHGFNDRDGSVEIDAENLTRYREAVEELNDIVEETNDILEDPNEIQGLEFMEARGSEEVRQKVDLSKVKTRVTANVDDEEEIREELGELVDEVKGHSLPKSTSETEEIKDYEKHRNNDLEHKVNEILDSLDNRYLEKAARTVVDEPEMVEITTYPDVFSEMEGTLHEYEPKDDQHEKPSDELLEKLEELYDRGIIEAEREIGGREMIEWCHDFGPERFTYPDPTDTLSFKYYGEIDEEHREKLREMRDEGLITLEEPSEELYVEKNSSEMERIRLQIEGSYRVEEVDMGGEMEVNVSYEPGDELVYEANDQIRSIAETMDPMKFEEQPFGQVELQTEFSI